MNNTNICYWCGKRVLDGEGSREHLVPRTILQDSKSNISNFIIPKTNAHKNCNSFLAENYEHDFCQILFHYSFDDKMATKHNKSKIRNLKRRLNYAKNQFSKMKKFNDRTVIKISKTERNSFEKIIEKIIKGLYLKNKNRYLDIGREFSLEIVWNTLNLEYNKQAEDQVKIFLKLINDQKFIGNDITKYRFKKTVDGESYFWEIVFYNRFPVYIFLINKNDKHIFNKSL